MVCDRVFCTMPGRTLRGLSSCHGNSTSPAYAVGSMDAIGPSATMSFDPSQPSLNPALTGLAQDARRLCSMLNHAEIERHIFLERCTSLVAKAIGCSRTGIWIFMDTDAGRILRCVAMYDAVAQRMTHVPDERDSVGPYFQALDDAGYVMADDARTHPATAAFFSRSLAVNGVRSLLAVGVSINGSLYGAFTCTQVGQPTQWAAGQLALLRRVSLPVSMALYKASRFTPDTGPGPLV